MIIELDQNAGFCFGVVYAIQHAEKQLEQGKKIYCLGDIVHNHEEVKRLEKKGLITIDYEQYKKLRHETVLLRSHGEPPETYRIAYENHITLIDATCPVVLKLQQLVKTTHEEVKDKNGQVIIFGKKGHAEVEGLAGQTDGEAIVVSQEEDLRKIDFHKPSFLYSQTTKQYNDFRSIQQKIEAGYLKHGHDPEKYLVVKNTICKKVANRQPKINEFAETHDVIIFVSGKNSSNGRMLFEQCKSRNTNSYFVSEPGEIKPEWFDNAYSVGISGATSTPDWVLKQVKEKVQEITEK
mgnify:CR=1 FL=1